MAAIFFSPDRRRKTLTIEADFGDDAPWSRDKM
jgi:hypothetical protein